MELKTIISNYSTDTQLLQAKIIQIEKEYV
jgi:hypothetical protein